jgi:thiol:disulfide interchange protein
VRERASATLRVPVRVASLEVTYQGCDPVHGLCYLPRTTTVQIH